MEEVYFDDDARLDAVPGPVAIIGSDDLALAHALNLRDSGIEVRVGFVEEAEASAQEVSERGAFDDEGLAPVSVAESVEGAAVVVVLVPVEQQREVWAQIEPHLHGDAAVLFGEGFAVHFGFVRPSRTHDVVLVAMQAAGREIRDEFMRGRGVPALVAVQQDASDAAWDLALGYAKALGGTRGGAVPTTFIEATEADLFSSQAVTGAIAEIAEGAFNALADRGFAPEIAYLAVSRALERAADEFARGGVSGIHGSRSAVAEFGDYTVSGTVARPLTEAMGAALDDVSSGAFAQKFVDDAAAGSPLLTGEREKRRGVAIDEAGADVAQLFARKR